MVNGGSGVVFRLNGVLGSSLVGHFLVVQRVLQPRKIAGLSLTWRVCGDRREVRLHCLRTAYVATSIMASAAKCVLGVVGYGGRCCAPCWCGGWKDDKPGW